MPLRRAVAHALHATGTTVTSAGLILAATFGVSALTGATEEIQQLGAESGILAGTAGFDDYADPSFVPDETAIVPYEWEAPP